MGNNSFQRAGRTEENQVLPVKNTGNLTVKARYFRRAPIPTIAGSQSQVTPMFCLHSKY